MCGRDRQKMRRLVLRTCPAHRSCCRRCENRREQSRLAPRSIFMLAARLNKQAAKPQWLRKILDAKAAAGVTSVFE